MSEILADPRSLKDPQIVSLRMTRLNEDHVKPLTDYVYQLRNTYTDFYVPFFDPEDGGIHARILFLFEKPGPKTCPLNRGSGFISCDNNDATAEATYNFLLQAGISRKSVAFWNTIPYWDGQISFETSAIDKIIKTHIIDLMSLFKNLESIVFVGRTAQKSISTIRSIISGQSNSSIRIVSSMHPSPRNRATRYVEWQKIPYKWQEALDSGVRIK